jgi:hypothetical protein
MKCKVLRNFRNPQDNNIATKGESLELTKPEAEKFARLGLVEYQTKVATPVTAPKEPEKPGKSSSAQLQDPAKRKKTSKKRSKKQTG